MYLSPKLAPRGLYSSAPPPQNAITNNPTLLVSWWCTGFALVIIILRLCGRWIRTEKMFREDKIMALSIIPLLGRMGLVHVVLRWGTNNTLIESLSAQDIHEREVGSKLVLPSRILYAAFLWIAKLTIAEFLRRTYSSMWKKSWSWALNAIRWFLGITFGAVVIATLVECKPFDHYWQVVPDPGPQCRQGFAQLITMGVSDIITDLILVAFPILVIVSSSMRLKRKVSLSLLFGLSLILVAITIYRIYGTIDRHSNQQFRSLLASVEILAAAAVSNALVLGSFVRDRGVKKAKFKFGSTGGESGLDRPTTGRARPRGALSWGSDEDLAGELGMRLGPEFQQEKGGVARPAPAALPLSTPADSATPGQSRWNINGRESVESDDSDLKDRPGRQELQLSPEEPAVLTPRRMSFFDVGGLLDNPASARVRRSSTMSTSVPPSDNFSISPLIHSVSTSQVSQPRGSRILLNDLGGILDSRRNSRARDESRRSSRAQSIIHSEAQSRRDSRGRFPPGLG